MNKEKCGKGVELKPLIKNDDYIIEYVHDTCSLTFIYANGKGMYTYNIKTAELLHSLVFKEGIHNIRQIIYEVLELI